MEKCPLQKEMGEARLYSGDFKGCGQGWRRRMTKITLAAIGATGTNTPESYYNENVQEVVL